MDYNTPLVIIVKPQIEEPEEPEFSTQYSFTEIVGLIASSIPVVESSADPNALTITSSESII